MHQQDFNGHKLKEQLVIFRAIIKLLMRFSLPVLLKLHFPNTVHFLLRENGVEIISGPEKCKA